jgi:hypothetical protein
MIRFRPAAAVCAAVCALAPAADPPASPIERAVLVQRGLAAARADLLAGRPRDAADALEPILPAADGNPDVLRLLRQAYTDELKQPVADPARATAVRQRLAALTDTTVTAASPPAVSREEPGRSPPPPPPPSVPEAPPAEAGPAELVRQASALFAQGRTVPASYAEAAGLFARAYAARAEMTADQLAAWAYCRVRAAAERWNASRGDPALAAETAAEIEDALRLAPAHPDLQRAGRDVLARVTGKPVPPAPAPSPAPAKADNPFVGPAKAAPPAAGDAWFVTEAESVRVRFPEAARELAAAVLAKAGEQRAAVFARWSGPPAGAWSPKCEIVIHPTAAAFAAATGQPPQATGHALVTLDGGRPTERRIDLRADDPSAADDALPRELTHVILADLFPTKAPPAWAAFGMAVLATSPAEIDRHLATAAHRAGELPTTASLLAGGPPAAGGVTGWAAGSVAVVDYLVRLGGEKSFTVFLRAAERYGPDEAVKRSYGRYGITTVRQLDAGWRRAATATARGPKP